MRSKLIDEIFSVEEQAAKLVNDAKEQRKSLLVVKEQEGQKFFQDELAKEKTKANQEIEKYQLEATKKIESFQNNLLEKEKDNLPLIECAQKIADKMVNLISTTSVGGS